MIDWLHRIEATNGLTIFPTADRRWQVSTRNDDGSFRVFIADTLEQAMEAAVPEDDFDIADFV